MSTSIECIVLLFLGLDFVVALHSLICNGVELGIQLKLALEGVESVSHQHVALLKEGEDWTEISYDEVKLLMNQKALKDGYTISMDPKIPVMILDLTFAASTFTNMQTLLGKMWGLTGVPLRTLCTISKGTQ